MNLFILIGLVVGGVVLPATGFAQARVDCGNGMTYSTCAESNPNGEYYSGCPTINRDKISEKCAKTDTVWWRGVGIMDCISCVSGASKVVASLTYDGCNIYYNYCECTTTASCNSGSWNTIRAGYQSRIYSYALCGTCKNETQYRCAPGYYGTTTNGTSGCTRCPSSGGVYGTSAAGSTSITSCYLPAGTSFGDSTGSGQYTTACYYKN